MIATLEVAICDALALLPGVATARPYAGEIERNANATLMTPALLVAAARLRLLPDPGTGQLLARTYWSVFACARQAESAEARGRTAWALATAVLLRAHGETWGVPGVSPALLMPPERLVEDEAGAVPLWDLEDRALAVREVRWTHDVRIGASDWDGAGLAPAEVWLGIAPRIGEMGGTAEDYWRVAAPPGGLAP